MSLRQTSQETICTAQAKLFSLLWIFFPRVLLTWTSVVHERFVQGSGKLPGKLGPARLKMHCSCFSLNWKDNFEAPGHWQDTPHPFKMLGHFGGNYISRILMLAHTEELNWKCLKANYDLDTGQGLLILYSCFFWVFFFCVCEIWLLRNRLCSVKKG